MTTDKPTCGTCRHWSKSAHYKPCDYRMCYRIASTFDVTEKEAYGEQTALIGSSDQPLPLITQPEFGCNLWEPTNGQ